MRRFRDIVEDIKAPSPQSLWLDKGELKFFGAKGWTSMVGGGDEDRQELEEKVDSLDKEMGAANNDIKKLQSSKLTCLQLQIGNSDEVKQHNLKELQGIAGFFFTELDYGYGVGTYQSSTGGFAHVVTAHDNNTYYDIAADGSIVKNDDYISPNEPYTIQLDSNDIGKPLEDVMASHILNCGEIIVNGVTGPVTYTRSVDSTESMIYFISSKKDNSFQILTYNVSSKTITSAISKYTVPAATKSSIGGVKAMTNIADVVNGSTTQDTVDVLVGTVNSLLSQLRAVGLIIN
mgnify:CR=1 FL=1|nr:MAG TPA: Head fiber protein [Crassvirales sp.]